MSILKAKIALAQKSSYEAKLKSKMVEKEAEKKEQKLSIKSTKHIQMEEEKPAKVPKSRRSTKKGSTSCKNIMKNYSRALVNFALSDMALTYLTSRLARENLQLNEFKLILNKNKEKVNCIKSLRDLLLIEGSDNQQMIGFKRIFQEICEIFLKFFSANWIFNSKVVDKKAHLNYRFKILRRIRNPVHFTYLESFSQKN